MKDAARDKLADVALRLEGALNDIDNGWVFLPEDDANFLLHAMQAFLSGQNASLDSAFGITRQRGRPKSGAQKEGTMALVKAAIRASQRQKNATWTAIAEDTTVIEHAGKNGISVDYLRKLVERHGDRACHEMARERASRIVAKLNARDARSTGGH